MAQQPPIETVKFTEARQNLSRLVNRVARRETRVLIEKSGIPAVAIVPAEDLQRLDQMEARRLAQIRAMDEISEAFADVPIAELERQVELALAEVRAEMAAERAAAGDQ